ncbi:hypothetical protein RHGRI_031110 [Rhododendron griersonianum]|uniref:BZIP domain-containing protein n=1 Tax=Rhododendron griersonianum TaxID=479676 RepID=A0AAV6I6Y8_9ERIC|nr:hypothetical protein RHGRI_031110 [Rhododendron griersonianum]
MGSSETKKPKEPKTPTPQEQSSSTPTGTMNPDWSGFQAYSPMPPPGFLASSPQAHPYMWGVQHIMPPYGTAPHPYVAVYPHGGIYAHPSIPPGSYPFSPFPVPSPNGVAEASGNTPSSMDTDGKLSEGREKLPIKRSKKSLSSSNMITGKNNGPGKTSGTLANGVCSRSAESASEHSSEGSDADSQNVGLTNEVGIRARFFGRFDSEASQNSGAFYGSQNGGPNTPPTMVNHTMAIMPPCVPGPTTNLNIGMDYWGAANSATPHSLNGNATHGPVAGGMITAGSRESIQSQPWPQDERELKRQRRKQSNRESARRSRLRKQTECDELALRTEALNEENATLRTELSRIRSEYEQLFSENASLKVRKDLGRLLRKKILGLVRISIQLAYGYATRALAECYNVLLSGLCIGTWKVEAMRRLNSSGICHLNGLPPIAEGLLEKANELLGEMVGEDHTPNALVIF